MTKKMPPTYAYSRDADGVDDLWVVYHIKSKRDICHITFWDSSPDWMKRAERKARLVVRALNAYSEQQDERRMP